MRPIIAIIGPTAIGKTRLALQLAQHLEGEIIGADSRQVYRYMDIGTAKPTPGERALVPHHLVDIIDPDEPFSIALYQELACQTIQEIQRRDGLVFLVGGSGLYAWGIMEGWKIPKVAPDHQFRHLMEQRTVTEGKESLHAELRTVDPVAAEKIDFRNTRRVIRALEVIRATGTPISQLQQKDPPPFPTLIIGLTTSRDHLYQRIDERVDHMMSEGLVEEVNSLLERGYDPALAPMSGMGYKQVVQYLQGEKELSAATEETKFETHRFARHQYAWFRLADPRIHWFDITRNIDEPVTRLVDKAIS